MSSRKRRSAMARPRPRRSASRATPRASPLLLRIGRRVWAWMRGPKGQTILATALIGLGISSVATVAGVNAGTWMNRWAHTLVWLFGWGAYPVAAFFTALGLLWLRHLVHRPTAWRWRPFLGMELTLLGLLTITHTLFHQQGWHLVESGRGGGVVGWAFYVFLSQSVGGPTMVFTLMMPLVLLGVGLAFDLTGSDLSTTGHRLRARWSAWRQHRAEAKPTPPPPPSSPKPKNKPRKEKASSPPSPSASPLPPLTLLREGELAGMSDAEIREKSHLIERTLGEFGLPVRVVSIRPGPTVTQFGVEPGYIITQGPRGEIQRKVRVSQIAARADDLALTLAARSLRIQAPVPGKAVVGIEVPNPRPSIVTLRSVLASEAFAACEHPLCFAVGLDVAGAPVVADLAQMPHLLIAGTTGSGKSVFVKSLAVSLVMRNPPEALRFIAIDPKIVELSRLNGLPHFLGPTETTLEQSLRALRWTVHEMEERYKRFASASARNLDDFNRKLIRRGETPLPRIIVLIDELADLMMAAPDKTEHTLTRLAQMARATGIHLVVATQRPSTDVVTGLIKANFPARISFATASAVDSRVILDTPGAETLLGRGDMLFLPPDAPAPLRVQGCYLSDEELEAVIAHWQRVAGSPPDTPPWQAAAAKAGPIFFRVEGHAEDADLLERAIAIARKRGRISTSGLQRALRISYPRAARLMEEMERMGIVAPQESAGRKRRVLLDDEP